MNLADILNMRYDDFLYRDDKQQIIEKLEFQKQNLLKCKEYNERHYKNIITIYNDILSDLSTFLNQNIEDDLMIYIGTLSAIVWKGYLSYLKQFRFDDLEVMDLEGYNGIDILSGIGCCRHLAFLFKDFFDKTKYDIKYTLCREYDVKADFGSLNFSRYSKDGVLSKCGLRGYQNSDSNLYDHAAIIFSIKNNYFVFDPTNIQLYKMKGTTGQMSMGIGKIEIYPFCFPYYLNVEIDDYMKKLKQSKIVSDTDKLWDKMMIGSNFVNENKLLFDEFYKKEEDGLREIKCTKEKILKNLNN